MISIDVIQRSAQMLLPDLDGCYWVISVHENTHVEEASRHLDSLIHILEQLSNTPEGDTGKSSK